MGRKSKLNIPDVVNVQYKGSKNLHFDEAVEQLFFYFDLSLKYSEYNEKENVCDLVFNHKPSD